MKKANIGFLRYFRKDDGAHFTYNFGVSMMRMGLLAIPVILIILFIIYVLPTNNPKYVGEAAVQVADLNLHTYTNTDGTDTYFYYVSFWVTIPHTDTAVYVDRQSVSRKMYKDYSEKMKSGKKYKLNLYRTTEGASTDNMYYVSKKSGLSMRIEYHRYIYTKSLAILYMLCIGAIVLMFLAFGAGMSQIRLSMKYPRTDIALESTNITLYREQQDMMKEFDEAQKRMEIRRRLGLSADEPIPKEYLNGTKRLDKKK